MFLFMIIAAVVSLRLVKDLSSAQICMCGYNTDGYVFAVLVIHHVCEFDLLVKSVSE